MGAYALFGVQVVTKAMHPAGTTDGTIERLEAKIKRLERRVTELMEEVTYARSAGIMEGTRRCHRR